MGGARGATRAASLLLKCAPPTRLRLRVEKGLAQNSRNLCRSR